MFEIVSTTTKAGHQVLHPKRPKTPSGVLYSRVDGNTGSLITIELIDTKKHLDIFHEWHNKSWVYEFWELNRSKADLKDYLEKSFQDPHQDSLIYSVDGRPVGYIESYWTKEDRLGPYYDSGDFDQGFHLLIGERSYLGKQNVQFFLQSVCDYLFSGEVRTSRIMGEPRYDNRGLLKYLERFKEWRFVKEFDFPHKRAALLECRREDFYREFQL